MATAITRWRISRSASERQLRKAGLLAGLLTGLLTAGSVPAYETDQYTARLESLEDSLELLDARVNASIAGAVAHWRGRRDDKRMVSAIYHDIGGHHWVDRIEKWAMESEQVDRSSPGRYDSIYRGHPLWATRFAGLFGVGPTLRVNGVLIGSDKLGHFLSQGRKYWLRYARNGNVTASAERSAFTERALFGQMTTGVYSNADLVANYEGFVFYRSLFEDAAIPGKPAILAWRDEGWVIQRPFTWADHVNPYWDEALNVNHYDNLLRPHMEERLQAFCPDFRAHPEHYEIRDEAALRARYGHLQLRDTRDMRMEAICRRAGPAPGATVTGSRAQPR